MTNNILQSNIQSSIINRFIFMKQGSTLFLKGVVVLMGFVVLVLCIFVLPPGIRSQSGGYRPIILGMYVTTIPFFIALYQALKLLGNIDKNTAFSVSSVKCLGYIKYCGGAISAIYAVGMPYIFIVAQRDDAPGVVLMGLIFTFAPLMVAIIAAVLEKIFQDAISIKSENDQII